MTWPSTAGYALYSGSNSWSTPHLFDNATVISSTEGFSVAPTSTSQIGLIINNPSSTSVDVADFENNGTKEVTISNAGVFSAAGAVISGGNTTMVSGGTGGIWAPVEGTDPTTITGGATLD